MIRNVQHALSILAAAILLAVLLAITHHNFLFFHGLVEVFAVVVACAIFIIAWNSRPYLKQDGLLLLGIAYLFVGLLDLVHTLAYAGMGVLPDADANAATQLWIAARSMESVALLVAVAMPSRRVNAHGLLAAGAIVTSLLLASILIWEIFPPCFVEGTGLTLFKRIAEYVICLILFAAIPTILTRRTEFDPTVLKWIIASIVLTIASELFFTFYVGVFDLSNLLGHVLKLASFCCIYRAVIHTGLRNPFKLLFRDLKEAESRYRSLFANMIDGFAYHQIVTDENGKPVDYVFLEVNDAFERLTGLERQSIIGRRVTEVLPGIADDPADWIAAYGKVALEGRSLRFENYSERLNRWYLVSAYSPFKGFFATVFQDVTKRKRMESALRQELHETTAKLETRTIELRRAVSELNMAEHRERNRLAHILHDHLQQLLFAAMLGVSVLEGAADDDENARRIKRVVDLLKETIDETRHLTSELSPPILSEQGLAAGLAWLARWMQSKHNLAVDLDCEDPGDTLPEDMRILLFESARELLFNVVKHAQTSRAWIRVWCEEGLLCVAVRDEGAGFDAQRLWDNTAHTKTGFGLRTIRDRLAMAGGRIEIDSQPDDGTMFTMLVPLARGPVERSEIQDIG